MRHYHINEDEALRACAGLIDAYEDGALMSEVRVAFAKQMFARLDIADARLVVRSYPFCDIVARSDILHLF